RPRIWSATSRPFCADSRTPRNMALVSMSVSLLLRRRRSGLALRRVRLERAGQRELAELVADHVLRHIDRYVLPAVMDGDRQPDEIGRDRRAARPGFDRTLVGSRARSLDLLQQMTVDERT